MSKKIIAVSLIILVLTVVLAACKSNKKPEEPENTDKVVNTVTLTGKDGGTTVVEIYENNSGDRYITNTDGDKIPLTTDSEGFVDDIGYIVTLKPSDNSSSTPSSSTKADESGTKNQAENESGGILIVDSDENFEQDSIRWDDIKNPKK